MYRKEKGFTLLEIMVIIIIVGIFAGILAPLSTVALRTTKIKETKRKLEILNTALLSYYENYAIFPIDPAGLTALETAGYVSESDYADDYACDAWRVPFVYTYNVGGATNKVRSYGPDRADGGGDDIIYIVQAKDIWNKWRQTTEERLGKVNEAVEKHIRAGNTIGSGDSSVNLAAHLDAANIYDPWGNPYRYDAALSTFYSYGPDGTPGSGDEVYSGGIDMTP
ncbi:MAG: type II secretion system protein GspG [Candidatus Saelkia tenebricola]|nr:type II secretion system protein GspG [Candidatus Saelkia tenebricola]